jgi:hypothetical protein
MSSLLQPGSTNRRAAAPSSSGGRGEDERRVNNNGTTSAAGARAASLVDSALARIQRIMSRGFQSFVVRTSYAATITALIHLWLHKCNSHS